MLHEQVRQARIAAGLNRSELARLAGVPRKQVRVLEEGGNVTLATLRKIASALPELTNVTLGGLEIAVANADLEEARKAALDLFDVAKRLMAALGAAPAAEKRKQRPELPSDDELETARRLERLIDEPELDRNHS